MLSKRGLAGSSFVLPPDRRPSDIDRLSAPFPYLAEHDGLGMSVRYAIVSLYAPFFCNLYKVGSF